MRLKFCSLIALALLASAPAFAAGGAGGLENLDALERRLVIALGADIGQPGGPRAPLDRRMKLAACPAEVAIDAPALGAVALRCAPLGWRIRVPLRAGGPAAPVAAMAVVAPAAKAEPVIRRGDRVELAAGMGGFRVTSEVIAEQEGAPGDRIRVRADRKSPVIMAEVVAAGHARLPGFN